MKKLVLIAVILFAGYEYFNNPHNSVLNSAQLPASVDGAQLSASVQGTDNSDAAIANAFSNHESDRQVSGQGIVLKLLSDDNSGSRHQKFIIKLASGQTLLVAHNIDLAPRVATISEGDSIEFSGVYEWNEKGGVLHWTHLDPNGSHTAGWLKHQGQTYQ